MLCDVLNLFEQEGTALCLDDIAARLDKPASAVAGMLDFLVSRGKLVEQQRPQGCDSCPLQTLCRPSSTSHRFFTLATATRPAKAIN